jgi:CheY-like chemotaxis protein
MIVDDEPDFLDVGREMLVLLGYSVITAGDSDEAVARFEKASGKIKLVIVDMIMPGLMSRHHPPFKRNRSDRPYTALQRLQSEWKCGPEPDAVLRRVHPEAFPPHLPVYENQGTVGDSGR